MQSNFRSVIQNNHLKEIEEKNKHINVLIANQERNRIGQDLHDTLGHVFASISLKSELAAKFIDQDNSKAKAEINEVNNIAKASLSKIREIINDLKVQSFEEEVANLDELLKNANLKFNFKNIGVAKTLSPMKQSLLSMILREAINNVIKHSDATKIGVELSTQNQDYILDIYDNGKGIKSSNIQLTSIEERVELLKGVLKVVNNSGLHIQIIFPRGVE